MLRAVTMPISAQVRPLDLHLFIAKLRRGPASSRGLTAHENTRLYAEIGIKSAERHQDASRPNFYYDSMKILHFIDSHTGGEPTRLVTSGGPDLGGGSWPSAWKTSARNTTTGARVWSQNHAVPT